MSIFADAQRADAMPPPILSLFLTLLRDMMATTRLCSGAKATATAIAAAMMLKSAPRFAKTRRTMRARHQPPQFDYDHAYSTHAFIDDMFTPI